MAAALLIIDVQNTLCRGDWAAFDVDTIVKNINTVAENVRGNGDIVVFIQHEDENDAMRFGSEGWHIYEGLNIKPEDLRVRKTACDSFFKTELRETLELRGVNHVLVCGMQTEYCVDSTVRGALANGLSVTLIADGHTTLDNDILSAKQIIAHHNATLANLGNFGPTIKVEPTDSVCLDA